LSYTLSPTPDRFDGGFMEAALWSQIVGQSDEEGD